MAGLTTTPISSTTTLIFTALINVLTVFRELQAAPRTFAGSFVTNAQVVRWRGLLQAALNALGQIVTIQIFPPPPIATLVNQATTLIRAALTSLQGIQAPGTGFTLIPAATVQSILSNLRQAALLLLQALFLSFQGVTTTPGI